MLIRPDLLSMSVYEHVHHTLYDVCRRQPFTSDKIYCLCRHIHMYIRQYIMYVHKHVHHTMYSVCRHQSFTSDHVCCLPASTIYIIPCLLSFGVNDEQHTRSAGYVCAYACISDHVCCLSASKMDTRSTVYVGV